MTTNGPCISSHSSAICQKPMKVQCHQGLPVASSLAAVKAPCISRLPQPNAPLTLAGKRPGTWTGHAPHSLCTPVSAMVPHKKHACGAHRAPPVERRAGGGSFAGKGLKPGAVSFRVQAMPCSASMPGCSGRTLMLTSTLSPGLRSSSTSSTYAHGLQSVINPAGLKLSMRYVEGGQGAAPCIKAVDTTLLLPRYAHYAQPLSAANGVRSWA